MKGSISKALLFKDRNNIVWMVMLLIIYLYKYVWKFLLLIGNIDYVIKDQDAHNLLNAKYIVDDLYINVKISEFFNSNNTLSWTYILGAAISIFVYDRMKKNNDILNSMPFRRESIILTKYFSAILIIMLPLIIAFLAQLLMCLIYYPIIADYFGYAEVSTFMLMNILTGAFIIAAVMLGQCIAGRVASGVLVSGFILFLPIAVLAFISQLFFAFAGKDKYITINNSEEGPNQILNIINNITPVTYSTNYEGKVALRSIVLIVLTVIIVLASIYAYKKSSMEREGSWFMYTAAGKLIKSIAGAHLVLAAADFAILYIDPTTYIWRIITAVCGLIIGIFFMKLFKERLLNRFMS